MLKITLVDALRCTITKSFEIIAIKQPNEENVIER